MPEFDETPQEIQSEIKISSYQNLRTSRKPDIPLAVIFDYLRLHPDLSRKDSSWLFTKFYGRLAAPWTCLVVVLIAIPFGAASGRRNLFFGVAGSIFICFTFFVLQQVSLALGSGGYLPAWLAAWLPNFDFRRGGFGADGARAMNLNFRIVNDELSKLMSRFERLQLLYQVSNVIHSTLEAQEALQLIVSEAVRLMRASSGSVVLINPTSGFLEISASQNLPGAARRLKLRAGEGITGWVARHGKPARVRRRDQRPALRRRAARRALGTGRAAGSERRNARRSERGFGPRGRLQRG